MSVCVCVFSKDGEETAAHRSQQTEHQQQLQKIKLKLGARFVLVFPAAATSSFFLFTAFDKAAQSVLVFTFFSKPTTTRNVSVTKKKWSQFFSVSPKKTKKERSSVLQQQKSFDLLLHSFFANQRKVKKGK